MRRLPLLARGSALLFCLAAPASALAAPSLTDYYAGSGAFAVATGADGNVWYTDAGDPGAVGRITRTGSALQFYGLAANSQPLGIAAGPGGMWFAESKKNKIARVTSTGSLTQYPSGNHSTPTDIVAGPDGNLWFTAAGDGGAVDRITPSGVVTEFETGLTDGGQPADITLGADGNLWFILPGTNRVGRVTRTGVITEFGAGVLTGTPRAITAGPDGNLWVTEGGLAPAIARITPTGDITEFSSGLPMGASPRGITAGADGALYVADAGAATIERVTTLGAITPYGPGLTSGAQPQGITSGADGRLWFAEQGTARIGRLTVAPGVTPVIASAVTDGTAALSGAVSANSESTTSHFEYGTTASYGQSTPTASGGSTAVAQEQSASLTGLQPDTTYHARLVATNATGTTTGPDRTFTTTLAQVRAPSGSPAPAPAPPAPPAPGKGAVVPPVPQLGREAVASVVRGTVLVQTPGGTSQALGADAAIPSGSIVDTRGGTLELQSALDGHGHTQSARFHGARFEVSLSRKHPGVVDIRLTGRPHCAKSRFSSRAATTAQAPIKLWSKDHHGRYRTQGHNSVATVRGTEWTTTETCAGTLTHVLTGTVSVRDLATDRTTLVRAGHSHLARPKRP